MGIALTILSKYWKLIAVGVLIASAYFYMQYLYTTIDVQAHKITELNAANKVLDDNNKKLTGAITANNDAIEKLSKSADVTNKAFAGLNASVKTQTSTLDSKLAAILKDKKPQTCEDTIRYLIEASKGFNK